MKIWFHILLAMATFVAASWLVGFVFLIDSNQPYSNVQNLRVGIMWFHALVTQFWQ